jgi:hypothetical protein
MNTDLRRILKGSVVNLDPHHFGADNLDPHPHQIKNRIRIRIKMISWIRNRIRINFQMTSQNVWNISLFKHIRQGFEPLFGS